MYNGLRLFTDLHPPIAMLNLIPNPNPISLTLTLTYMLGRAIVRVRDIQLITCRVYINSACNQLLCITLFQRSFGIASLCTIHVFIIP